MGNLFYYGKTPLNVSMSNIDDSLESGVRTWSSQKILDTINEINTTWHKATDVKIGQCAEAGCNGVSIGSNAGAGSSAYTNTVAIGTSATVKANCAIAIGSNSVATEFSVISIGAHSGSTANTGLGNVFIGIGNGRCNTTGDGNVFLGHYSGFTNTTGRNNTFIGRYSGYTNTTGRFNTFIGEGSGHFNATGSNNVFIGCGSGFTNTTGCYKVIVGDLQDVNGDADFALGHRGEIADNNYLFTCNNHLYWCHGAVLDTIK